ncbi:MAG: winged helix-turn-helix domain-containing protein, partial [Candidatus Lokiarchaeota archaeon]|nr:winged helix-turn-helix domain-containing protein [Candidatus Lokiarchaeota archaeon]
LKGPRSFSFMLDRLKIKRTSITHHLDLLLKSKLIEKEEWGRYQITEAGFEFIISIIKAYKVVRDSPQNEQEKIFNEWPDWPDFLKEPRIINENKIRNPALYEGGWNSYISSITGVLNVLGVQHDYIYTNGIIGYCFLVSIPGIIKTSLIKENNPTDAWQEIYKGTESFGWHLKKWEQRRNNPGKWNLTGEDIDIALKVFNQVKEIIDKYEKPVILFGIHGAGFGIINGYRNDSYLVSSYFRKEGRKEVPVRFDQLRILDKFIYYYFEKEIEKEETEVIEKNALKRALEFAQGTVYSNGGYIVGPQAYDFWIDLLNQGKEENIDNFGNSVLGIYYFDAKEVSFEYLNRLARKYKNTPQGVYLKEASKNYRDAKIYLEQFTVLFPYFEPENSFLTLDKRNKGIEILENVKINEIEAIKNLEKSIEKWV